jgi:hypothetical protein
MQMKAAAIIKEQLRGSAKEDHDDLYHITADPELESYDPHNQT